MKNKTIAVIGGGGGGAAAAWALSRVHDVTLFEADAALGGHAYTAVMDVDGVGAHIDMGVEYFNERIAPNLCAMLDHFEIETYVAPLSMRAIFPGQDNCWSNVRHDGALWRTLHDEFDRFHLDMTDVIRSGDRRYKKMSIDEFLDEREYSGDFKNKALLPLMTVFSGCDAPSLSYNLMYCSLAFNMNLLSFFSSGYWRKAKGGINAYLARIADELGNRVLTSCPVHGVERRGDKVWVSFSDNRETPFDAVVFATHADVALSLLRNPRAEQRDFLSKFEYVRVTSIFHQDDDVLAGPTDGGEYCEFVMPDADRPFGMLTRINNALFPYRSVNRPLLVSFDPKRPIREDRILAVKHWKLPKLRPVDLLRKAEFRRIQGVDGIWFCGTDTSLTGHEGALTSGLAVAERLGAPYPFADNAMASIQLNIVKDIMGIRKNSELASSMITEVIFGMSKKLGLHKSQSHKFIRDAIM